MVAEIKSGIPEEIILREAEGKSIDLIVMGERLQTDLLRPVTGGITDKVVKRAKCRVSVILRSSDRSGSGLRELRPTEK